LSGNLEGRDILDKFGTVWRIILKTSLKWTVFEGMDLIDMVQWQAVVNTVMNLLVP
jgi:hypothetical protein